MSEQITLPGFDPEPPRGKPTSRTPRRAPRLPHSLFFALFPPPGDAARIAQLAQALSVQHGLAGKLLAPGRLHVTLHDLGGYADGVPQELVAAAKAAAAAVAVPRLEVVFDRALSFAGNGAFVLRSSAANAPLTSLLQALGGALQQAGVGTQPSRTPHMTLAYDDCRVAEHGIETVHWPAAEFVLVHSLVGKTEHVPLGRWSLTG